MTTTYDVPAGTEAFECPHCEAVEPTTDLLALHKAQAHYDRLSPAELAAYETAYDAEQARIRQFRLAALGGLVLLYFGLLLTYAIAA
jgi:hypothetical protein